MCITLPAKLSASGKFGIFGTWRAPWPDTRTRAVKVAPCSVLTLHLKESESESEGGALLGDDAPPARLGVPVTLGDAVAEFNVLHQIELVRYSLQVVEDLLLPTEYSAPAWVWEKRKAVEMRGDVTAATRIRVLPPSSAQSWAFFQYREFRPLVFQLLAHAEA